MLQGTLGGPLEARWAPPSICGLACIKLREEGEPEPARQRRCWLRLTVRASPLVTQVLAPGGGYPARALILIDCGSSHQPLPARQARVGSHSCTHSPAGASFIPRQQSGEVGCSFEGAAQRWAAPQAPHEALGHNQPSRRACGSIGGRAKPQQKPPCLRRPVPFTDRYGRSTRAESAERVWPGILPPRTCY